jgi:hypothetical protein
MTPLAKKALERFGKPELAAKAEPQAELHTVNTAPVFHTEDEPEAVTWLRSRLTTPQPIARLIAEWVGPVDALSPQELNARLDTLMQARWALGVMAYFEGDRAMWWLPEEAVQ